MIATSDALIVIDPQLDFCPGGSLAVMDGDAVMAPIAALVRDFAHVVVTQDWHPAGHSSFASSHAGRQPFETIAMPYGEQVLWPDHCIQGTPGADFHPAILPAVARADLIVRKGMNPAVDSYSAFRDNDQAALTGLAGYLRAQQITELDVCGLATDYCVKFSALDAVEMLPDVKVRFIEDASRGITPEGVRAAIEEMRANGVGIIKSSEILAD